MSTHQRPSVSRSRALLTTALVVVATIATIGGGTVPASAGRAPTSSPVTNHAGRIAFSAYHGGVQQVFTMKEDGTGKTQITFDKTGDKKCDPTLSPDGTEVAYASGGKMYVHTIGGSAQNVAPSPEGTARGGGRRPAWSPDGNTVVFGFSTDWMDDPTLDADAIFDLWTVSRVSGGWSAATRLTTVRAGASAFQPRFNAAGTWISYTFRDFEVPSSAADLYVARVSPTPMTNESAGDLGFGTVGHVLMNDVGAYMSTWRADGRQISFVTSCTGGIHFADVEYDVPGGTPLRATAGAQPLVSSGGCGLSFSRIDPNRLTYADSSKVYIVKNTPDAKGNDVWATPVSIGFGSQPSW